MSTSPHDLAFAASQRTAPPALRHPFPLPQATPPSLPFYQLPRLDLPVDLWCCSVNELPPTLLEHRASSSLLSIDEQRRLNAFRFERDRRRYLAGRLLLRSTLSRYLNLEPQDIGFEQNAFGRPELASATALQARSSQSGADQLRFNLSRAGSLVMLAVSHNGEVGVDIEDQQRLITPEEVAPGVLAEDELMVFRAAPAHERKSVFLRYWVLKEAYAKGCGIGLSLDVRRLSFTPPGSDSISIRVHGSVVTDPARWRFAFTKLRDQYPLAVAYRPTSS